jgi:spore germination protein D
VKRPWKIGTIALATILAAGMLGGCGGSKRQESSDGGSQATEAKEHYNETKSMVLDILHTKEGMDTLKDIVRDPQFKQSLAINETDVQVAMQKALTDGSAHITLTEQMRRPQFASALAKSFKKDNQKMMKELMNDPEYQQQMVTLMKSPEFTQNMYDLMKTPDYRKQTMTIMTQALSNPEFKLMFMDVLKEAIRQGTTERTPNEKKAQGQDLGGGGGGGGGEQGGGEGGGQKKEDQKKQDEDQKKKKDGEEGGDGKDSGGGSDGGGGGQ